MSFAAVQKHIAVLERAGLVTKKRRGREQRVRTDAAMTRANGGLPLSGRGNFSVVVNDSGIDATHSDLKLGEKVIQNVEVVADTETLTGFTPLVTIENLPNTDTVGHGTHCAGILGGTGQMSGGRYEAGLGAG